MKSRAPCFFRLSPADGGMLLCALLLILAVGIPAARANHARRLAAVCSANLESIRLCALAYADARGEPPASLDDLVPAFFKTVPRCPSGGTYALHPAEGLPPTCTIPEHFL